MLPACSSPARDVGGSTDPLANLARNTARAKELTSKAVELMASVDDITKQRQAGALPREISDRVREAETLLRDAISADAFHGPAHNNLGVLHLAHNDLPNAASSFEMAATLMPTSPEPRVNLAITLERAGRFEAAVREYSSALELSPSHTRAAQALASLQLRHNLTDTRTPALLDHISLHGETQQWRDWAKQQRIQLR